LEKFGSFSSMLGIFASAFTRTPLVNALNASAGAMKAITQGDKDTYEAQYQKWKDNATLASKHLGEERERLKGIVDLQKEDFSLALAQARGLAAEKGWSAVGLQAMAGDAEGLGKLLASLDKGSEGYKAAMDQMRMIHEQKSTELTQARIDALKEGKPLTATEEKIREKEMTADQGLDDITKLRNLLEEKKARAGIAGSLESYGEPLENLFIDDAAGQQEFEGILSHLQKQMEGTGRTSATELGLIKSMTGGEGFKNSTAGMLTKMNNIQDWLMEDKNGASKALGKRQDALFGTEEPSALTGANPWDDAPVVSGE